MPLPSPIQQTILHHTQAETISHIAPLQSLWGGYGQLFRVSLLGGRIKSVIVKQVQAPKRTTDLSHQRKSRSYQVENSWYQNWQTDEHCRVAQCYFASEGLLLLEDLDCAGFNQRKSRLTYHETQHCLRWLSYFHARFLGRAPKGLWSTGSYWHLATRPDEFAALKHPTLKAAAHKIDARLNQCQYKTIIHGDAKSDNFCFHAHLPQVAAVDFQYVGAGCGMKDVVYLFDSCLDAQACAQWAEPLLADYFSYLEQAIQYYRHPINWQSLHQEWLALYPYAWADFYRFLLGWAGGNYPPNEYVREIIKRVLG